MKTENHRRDLIKYSIVLWIISLIIFLIAVGVLKFAYNASDESASAGSILQGTLGVAVAFAGAWVAIKIAQTANETIANQDRREFVKESTEAIEKISTDFLHMRSNFETIWVQLNFLDHVIMKQAEAHATFLENVKKHLNEKNVKSLNSEIYGWISNDEEVQKACSEISSSCIKQAEIIMNVRGHINTRAVLDSLPVEVAVKKLELGGISDVFSQLPPSLTQASRKIDELAYWLVVSALNIQQVPGSPFQEVTALEQRWTNMVWALGITLDHKAGPAWLLYAMTRFRYEPADMKKSLETCIIAGDFHAKDYTDKLFNVPAANVALKSGRYMQSLDELITFIISKI